MLAPITDIPNTFRLPTKNLDACLIERYLTDDYCQALIDLIDASAEPSGVVTDAGFDREYRSSSTCYFRDQPLALSTQLGICKIMGIDPIHAEPIQGQRYRVGEQYKQHHDFFHPTDAGLKAMERGGQRTWTVMIYLNEPKAGGATRFTKCGVNIEPRKGNALIWNNLTPEGEPNPWSMHAALPVEQGEKYILTQWFREREFI
jgi:prolyl 4-hydroxylase